MVHRKLRQVVAHRFGARIPQQTHWLDNRDAGRIEVYVGRLSGSETPNNSTWDRQIKLAERLLIYAHSPPMNTQKNLARVEPDLRFVRVLNWARHRDLLPEVSGARWTSRYDDIPNYHQFGAKKAPNFSHRPNGTTRQRTVDRPSLSPANPLF